MKIRSGFVSNSSSSSFLIYGVYLDSIQEFNPDPDDEDFDIYDYLYDKCRKLDLDCHRPYDATYIGKSWNEVGDNETGKEFKERTEAAIRKLLDGKVEKVKFQTYEESYIQ